LFSGRGALYPPSFMSLIAKDGHRLRLKRPFHRWFESTQRHNVKLNRLFMKRPRIKHKVATSDLGSTEVKAMRLYSPGEAKILMLDIDKEWKQN